MAHIVSCIAYVGTGSISKSASPALPLDSRAASSTPTSEEPFPWRMQQQPPCSQQKRYQLFPRERQLPVLNCSKALDLEKASSLTMANNDDKPEKPSGTSSLKTKINQHSVVRRRKVSVPELGPMTTVQEVPMDSPTIPGRPPLHERSISAPAHDYKQQPAGSFLHTDASENGQDFLSAIEETFKTCTSNFSQELSSKQLTPLVIPQSTARPPQFLQKRPITHTRSGSVPNEAFKTSRRGEFQNARGPCTPSSSMSDLTTPSSARTNPMPGASGAPLATPISAPASESHRFSPKPWEPRSNTPTTMERSMTPQPIGSQRMHTPCPMERSMTPQPVGSPRIVTPQGYQGGWSESSIMDRGRPRKRADIRHNNRTQLKPCDGSSEKSSERRAFEELPSGCQPKDAAASMKPEEISALHKQAIRQAERFEVLKAEDVEALSKELRRLDERTEYLRRTYTSLRAGRRNLHSRICQFLRSPRIAKFSYESMLKQEEALAELDASIDDWVNKLEMAENRRTRVRQKLLEHVAGAVILSVPDATTAASESLHHAMGVQPAAGAHNISTPPRSPTKQKPHSSSRTSTSSPSPQRVVAQVPSTILEHPVVEEAEALHQDPSGASLRRADVESIRIYAGDGIATLLADVEDEISRMSQNMTGLDPEGLPDLKRKHLHREQSHELLNSSARGTGTRAASELNRATPDSPPAPTPPIKDSPLNNPSSEGGILLSNSIFRP